AARLGPGRDPRRAPRGPRLRQRPLRPRAPLGPLPALRRPARTRRRRRPHDVLVSGRAAVAFGPRPMRKTIPTLFEAAVEAVPDKPWLHHEDATYTYAHARERIAAAAAGLAGHGIGPGEIVLATTRNTPDYLFTWL